MSAYADVLRLLQPLGLLREETPDSLRGKIEEGDGEEEFLERLEADRARTLSSIVAAFDPNALLNPAERAKAVAAWSPPLWKHLGLKGRYDASARRARVEDGSRVLADEPVTHGCHAALAWTKALAERGFEALILDVGSDDESFLAVTRESAERIRRDGLLALSRPCPR